ncbi:MAG: LLM class F420-dependent oxidoreductase [Myxococcales bacterium]|nr:MAG: LLM class F420-dependent oxidoreductase [Myxococcales bacterium]
MKLGFFGINVGPCAEPSALATVAKAAEDAGYDSLWTGEHVVLPVPQIPPSPVPAETPFLDPAVALTFAAACTTKIKLATGIIILPQRNPLVLAKEFASLDVLSGGRVMLGVASGYLTQEFEALGIPFGDRGPRTDEYIDAIREMWTSQQPSFDGKFVSFSGIDAQPRPVQKPAPPIVIGGQSPPAYRRAIKRGNEWYGFSLTPEDTKICLDGLAAARQRVGRPAGLGDLVVSVTPPFGTSADDLKRYEDLGVHRLVPIGFVGDTAAMVKSIEETAAIF